MPKKKAEQQAGEQAVVPQFMQRVVTEARQRLDERTEDDIAASEEQALIALAEHEGWHILKGRIEQQIENIKGLVEGAGWDLEELGLRYLIAREIEYALQGVIDTGDADWLARREQVREQEDEEESDNT